MEIVSPEGRILSDETEGEEQVLLNLAENARHAAETLNQLRAQLERHGASLRVYDSPKGKIISATETRTRVEVLKTTKY